MYLNSWRTLNNLEKKQKTKSKLKWGKSCFVLEMLLDFIVNIAIVFLFGLHGKSYCKAIQIIAATLFLGNFHFVLVKRIQFFLRQLYVLFVYIFAFFAIFLTLYWKYILCKYSAM